MYRHLIVLAFTLIASAARPDAFFTFTEEGNDVVGRLSGSLNVSGLTPSTSPFVACSDCSFHSDSGAILATDDMSTMFDRYLVTGPQFFWMDSNTRNGAVATAGGASHTGQPFGLVGYQNYLYLPAGYNGGDLSTVLRLTGQSFASLGVDPSTYVYRLAPVDPSPDRTLSVVFGTFATAAQVPVPAGGALLLSAIGAAALLRRFRGRRAMRLDDEILAQRGL